MTYTSILSSGWGIGLLVIFALIIGSLLNMIIFRLPTMLYQSWQEQCHVFLQEHPNVSKQKINFFWPASHCPHCKIPLKYYYNIPILGYLIQRGRCHHCQQKISLRYPLVEIISVGMAIALYAVFGWSWTLALALILSWGLLALTVIDIDTMLLPDEITLSLLWLGLVCNSFSIFTDIHSAIYGAIGGYLSLWLIGHLFLFCTKREGMGYGDYKLLAALGAWLGWQMLLPILLIASLMGSIVGITLLLSRKIQKQQPLPFGPYLAVAGWICLIKGNTLILWWS